MAELSQIGNRQECFNIKKVHKKIVYSGKIRMIFVSVSIKKIYIKSITRRYFVPKKFTVSELFDREKKCAFTVLFRRMTNIRNLSWRD